MQIQITRLPTRLSFFDLAVVLGTLFVTAGRVAFEFAVVVDVAVVVTTVFALVVLHALIALFQRKVDPHELVIDLDPNQSQCFLSFPSSVRFCENVESLKIVFDAKVFGK